jgi:hypothetical protein
VNDRPRNLVLLGVLILAPIPTWQSQSKAHYSGQLQKKKLKIYKKEIVSFLIKNYLWRNDSVSLKRIKVPFVGP